MRGWTDGWSMRPFLALGRRDSGTPFLTVSWLPPMPLAAGSSLPSPAAAEGIGIATSQRGRLDIAAREADGVLGRAPRPERAGRRRNGGWPALVAATTWPSGTKGNEVRADKPRTRCSVGDGSRASVMGAVARNFRRRRSSSSLPAVSGARLAWVRALGNCSDKDKVPWRIDIAFDHHRHKRSRRRSGLQLDTSAAAWSRLPNWARKVFTASW